MFMRRFLLGCMFLLVSIPAYARDPEPVVMLKNVSNQMLHELDKHIKRIKNDDEFVHSLVNRVLVPHFDLTSMARSVVGRNYWQSASSDMQQKFIQEFTSYIIRTYSSALQSYDGETIKFYPLRGAVGSKVRVVSDLLVRNGPPIQIQYGLVQQGSEWNIYDFSVDGISIVKNYNAQFAGVLRRKGLAGLVQQLQKRRAK